MKRWRSRLGSSGSTNCAPGAMSTMEVEARSPAVTHTVSMGKVEDWLNGGAKSPKERLLKERLKGLLAG